MHEYKTPGTYTARCIVTNDAGSSEATKTIPVAVAAPKPVIDEEGTYLPQAITSLDKTFGLVFKIKNMGGATKIWLKSICRTTTRVLMDNVNLPAYGEVTIVTSPHDISWYCGYVPAVETPINILFEVGPAGGIVSDNLPWETFVTESNEVEFCPYNSHWDEATKSCVPDEAKTSKKAWWVIGAGAVAALFGALAWVAMQTVRGTLSLGDLFLYYSGFQMALSSLQSLLRGLAGLYEAISSLWISSAFFP